MSVNLDQSSPKTIHSLPDFIGSEMSFGPEKSKGMGWEGAGYALLSNHTHPQVICFGSCAVLSRSTCRGTKASHFLKGKPCPFIQFYCFFFSTGELNKHYYLSSSK
ncbi:hypothetical protein ACE6H2_012261 [Prunus campanulata]